jgi:hypothetical protein
VARANAAGKRQPKRAPSEPKPNPAKTPPPPPASRRAPPPGPARPSAALHCTELRSRRRQTHGAPERKATRTAKISPPPVPLPRRSASLAAAGRRTPPCHGGAGGTGPDEIDLPRAPSVRRRRPGRRRRTAARARSGRDRPGQPAGTAHATGGSGDGRDPPGPAWSRTQASRGAPRPRRDP